MKRFYVVLLTMVTVFSLIGCGQKAVDFSNVASEVQEGQVSPYNTPHANNPINQENQGDQQTYDTVDGNPPQMTENTQPASDDTFQIVDDSMQITNEQPLDLVEYGCKARTPSDDDPTVYIDYCGIVYNPNTNLSASFPEVVMTLQDGVTGTVVVTDSVMGMYIAPGDTVILCGTARINKKDKPAKMEMHFDLKWGEMTQADQFVVKTTDLPVTNISERAGNDGLITGEINNNSTKDLENVCVSLILRDGNKIVYMDTIYVKSVKVTGKQAIQFECYGGWPEHTGVEISAQSW